MDAAVGAREDRRVARKRAQVSGGGDSFTVLFTSLSILMLAFFILLNSMATMQDTRVKKALGSLTKAFSGFGGGSFFPQGDSLVTIGEELALLAEGPDQALKKKAEELIRAAGEDAELELVHDGDGIVLVFPDRILFDSGAAFLKPAMTDVLLLLAGFVRRIPYPVVVEGHTDNQPISTLRFPSNWELSTARAGAVVRRLLESHKIDASSLSGVGFGEYRPVAPNDTPENRAKNRRVAVRFVGMGEEKNKKQATTPKNGGEPLPHPGV